MKKSIIIFFVSCLLFFSCTKKLEVADPVLEVTPVATTVTIGTPVIFNFNTAESPDVLFFYSGEPFSEYAYSYDLGKGRKLINTMGYELSFQSRFDINSPVPDSSAKYGRQANQLSLWASTDFNGKLDTTSIKSAAWTNITSKFTLPTALNTSTFTNSGTVALTDVAVQKKPLYLGFKLVTLKQRTNGYSQFWNVQNFNIVSKDTVGSSKVTLYNIGNLEFNIVDFTSPIRPAITSRTSALVRMGGPNPYIGQPQNILDSLSNIGVVLDPDRSEVWAISRPVNVDTVFLGYDKPAATIANYTDVQFKPQFGYVYTKPGTYKAVFVGINRSKDETKQILKEFTITVNP